MFFLYHNNDLRHLAALFSALRNQNLPAPLGLDTVLVPNRGVGRWLTIQVAEDEGIATNIHTALPGAYIWNLLRVVNPEAPRGKHFEPDCLPWHLYFALPAMADEIPAVAGYLGTPVDEVRRYQLARQLADVFDKYMVYRADLLFDWERGQNPADDPGGWQARVWHYLTRPQRLTAGHRARALMDFVARLSRDRDLQQRVAAYCPGALYCFGLVAPAPNHLRLLYALSEQLDVHFLLPNPSQEYWGDVVAGRLPLTLPEADGQAAPLLPGEAAVESGHPLLGALGRMARDTLRLLYSDEFAGMLEPELGAPMAYHRPGGDSLLHRIQSDIVALDCSNPAQGMDAGDTSLEIHACHGPLREVQVLQDQLLDRLAADDQRVASGEIAGRDRLAPRDIIVMLPDVAAYAPAIEAVFGGAAPDRYLPFGLADRARAASHPIGSCVVALLDLPLSRWQASDLLALLAVPAVMRRFGISAGERDTITQWVAAAGIRWGRDAQHRDQLGAGAFEQNSWRFGLDRLLLGVAQADDETLIDGVAPWSDLEGGATAALGKLWRLERTLAEAAESLAMAATPGHWQTRLNALLDALIAAAPDAPDEQRAVDDLRQVFAQFEAAETGTLEIPLDADRKVSWEAVRELLHAALDSASEQQPFLAGGITFCGMVPLRAVPFRMVCVLGMNDDAFPRQDKNQTFNAMFQKPRLGDRNTRDDDRLLFLQALTAAGDTFYISYVGQNVHTGEELPPSPIVGETLEFIHRYYFRGWSDKDFHRRLMHRQPMQPFSLRYFSPAQTDPRVFTFAGHWRDASLSAAATRGQHPPLLDGSTAAPVETIEPIDLDRLRYFYDDPPRAFFRERLKLNLEIKDHPVEDAEPITLDALSASRLRQRLFDAANAENRNELSLQPSALELARGELPPPPLADAGYAGEAAAVNALLPVWQAWKAEGAPDSVDINLDIDGLRITGRVGQCWPAALRRLRTGKLTTKVRLRSWIDYLAVVATGQDVALAMAGYAPESKPLTRMQFIARIDRSTARAELARLIRLYLDGQTQPLHFHPDLADSYQNGAFQKLGEAFKPGTFHPHHLMANPYFALLLGDGDAPLGASEDDSPFIAAIESVIRPMNAWLQPAVAENEAVQE